MDSTIRWLHLTDLHVGMSDQDWLWPGMKAKFREDLQRIHKTAGPWDLVLFTGDLVQQGTQYAELERIFDEIWSWFENLQPGRPPQLLAVPGNHDLQWREATKAAVKVLENWAGDPDLREHFWTTNGDEYRQVVRDAFAAYDTWWRGTRRKPDGIRHGLLPGDFSCTFTKGDLRLGIVGLNSAFLQLTGKNDYRGRLALHPKQFHHACGGDGVRWAESHHACFLMTHHPPDWLNEQSRADLNGEILESFCLHLCGHNHETQVLQELSGGAQVAPLRWLGRSLFGLDKCDNGQLDRSHGYVVGELRARAGDKGQLQFMPRRREQQGNTWDLVPDHKVQLPKKDRTRVFPFPLRPVNVATKPPLARVASSSTDAGETSHALDGQPTEVAVSDWISDLAAMPAAEIDERNTPAEAERPEPNPKAAFIAHELLQVVCDQLNSDAEPFRTLRAQLTTRLARQADGDTETNVAFLVQALTQKLNEVLRTLRMWLDSTDRVGESDDVRRLIDAVSTAGFDAAWVGELLAELDAGHLHVPIETDLHLCEVIFTALYRKPAVWIQNRAIDHGAIRAVEAPSTKPDQRAREIRRRLVQTYFKDRISREVGESDANYEQRLDDWAERDLPGIPQSDREDHKPWFVLFLETVDALKKDMEIDPPLWSEILKLEKSRQRDRFVYDRPRGRPNWPKKNSSARKSSGGRSTGWRPGNSPSSGAAPRDAGTKAARRAVIPAANRAIPRKATARTGGDRGKAASS